MQIEKSQGLGCSHESTTTQCWQAQPSTHRAPAADQHQLAAGRRKVVHGSLHGGHVIAAGKVKQAVHSKKPAAEVGGWAQPPDASLSKYLLTLRAAAAGLASALLISPLAPTSHRNHPCNPLPAGPDSKPPTAGPDSQ